MNNFKLKGSIQMTKTHIFREILHKVNKNFIKNVGGWGQYV